MNFAKKSADLLGFYYGWVVVAVAFISMAFWMGIRAGFSVFYVALLEDFHWNRGVSAGVQSMALISYTLLSPVVGSLIDRFGPRRVVVPGILILTSGLMLCSTIKTLAQFYLFYGAVLGAGVTCIGIITYSAILSHWFEKKRGIASGLAVSGMGLGTFLLIPLSQSIITMWGWRITFFVTGALVLIVLLPANALFLRHKPHQVGQYPDGLLKNKLTSEPRSDTFPDGGTAVEWSLKRAVSSGRFWALIVFPFLALIGIYIILVHNVKFLVDQGVDKMTAALIFAMVGVISSVFRIFWGWLSDRIGRELTYTMGVICACLGVSCLLLFEASGIRQVTYAFLLLFGIGWGVTAPMFMAASADIFKGKIFGLIYGFVEAGIGIAGALGAWVAGFIFDKTGSYKLAFVLAIVVLLLSVAFIWLAAPRKAGLDTKTP